MVRRWAVVAVGLVGCSGLKNAPPAEVRQTPSPASAGATPVDPSPPPPPPRGEGEKDKTPSPTPPFPPREGGPGGLGSDPADTLTLAAEALQRGDRASAAAHLEAYVRDHPGQLMFRAQLAELLVALGRDDAARFHFERFAADARRSTGRAKDHLVHAHTRLMEVAQRGGDRFGESFHRGAGLLLLVGEQDADPKRDEGFCEQMLCKSLKALAEARELRPHDPRVRVWLAEAYDRTGNRRAADAERAAAGPSALSPLR